MSKTKKPDLSQRVMKEIQSKQIKMRPRFYFAIGSILLGIGVAGLMILAGFFVNLVFFRMRVHLPLGYFRGLRFFIVMFPWWPLLIALVGIFGGLALLRRYDISYQKSFLILAIALATFVLVIGFFLDRFRFNERVQNIRKLRPFYQSRFSGKRRQLQLNERKPAPFLYK